MSISREAINKIIKEGKQRNVQEIHEKRTEAKKTLRREDNKEEYTQRRQKNGETMKRRREQ